jgi:hypothetical protein
MLSSRRNHHVVYVLPSLRTIVRSISFVRELTAPLEPSRPLRIWKVMSQWCDGISIRTGSQSVFALSAEALYQLVVSRVARCNGGLTTTVVTSGSGLWLAIFDVIHQSWSIRIARSVHCGVQRLKNPTMAAQREQ